MFRLNQVSQLGDAATADRDTAIYQTACNTPRQDVLDSSKGEALTDVDPNRPFRTSVGARLRAAIAPTATAIRTLFMAASPTVACPL